MLPRCVVRSASGTYYAEVQKARKVVRIGKIGKGEDRENSEDT